MFNVIIASGISVTMSAENFIDYARTLTMCARELNDDEVTRKQKLWLRVHGLSDENYSDIYKEVYGFRPRW